MSATELLLIDLSAIAHQMWHVSQSEPDPDATATKTVDRVRALAASHPHAAVCCDSGRSFRHEIDPSYKAQRPQQEAPLRHQIALSRERLAADGFPVWAVKGFEADDLIATATARALAIEGTTVLIASADKDLLQLVGPRVRAKSTTTGDIADEAAVKAKFGVMPAQMRDYLSLVGDASDNVVGAKGIGPKRAAELLGLFETLDEVYAAIKVGNAKFPPATVSSLAEFDARRATVRELITLRADVPIPFEEIAAERVAKAAPLETPSMEDLIAVAEQPREGPTAAPEAAPEPAQPSPAEAKQPQAIAVRAPDVLAPAPSEWGKQLEPRSLVEAQGLATAMYNARLFNGYGNAPAVLSTIMAGRELGLQSMAALRAILISRPANRSLTRSKRLGAERSAASVSG